MNFKLYFIEVYIWLSPDILIFFIDNNPEFCSYAKTNELDYDSIRFVDKLPFTPTGKVQKRVLKKTVTKTISGLTSTNKRYFWR